MHALRIWNLFSAASVWQNTDMH